MSSNTPTSNSSSHLGENLRNAAYALAVASSHKPDSDLEHYAFKLLHEAAHEYAACAPKEYPLGIDENAARLQLEQLVKETEA